MTAKSTQKKSKKTIWIALAVLVILAGAGGGYFLLSHKNNVNTASAQSATMNTSQVRRGNLVLSASGAGTLTAGKTVNLSFPASGRVGELNVQVGDKVTEGQVLAVLQDTTSLLNEVTSAQLTLKTYQEELENLQANAGAALANAQLALAEAKKTYTNAQSALKKEGMVRCDQESIDKYYQAYLLKKAHVEEVTVADDHGDQNYYLTTILPAKNEMESAYAAYEYCAGYTEYEIESSQANLTLAETALKEAQATVDTLIANSGIDPDKLAQAQNAVETAQLACDQAEKNLNAAAITAPFEGTVLTVAGEAGDEVGTGTFISMADLLHPQVSFSIDETDMDKVAVGNQAEIIFDAWPERTFSGEVIQVNPNLASTNGYQVLSGMIRLDLSAEKEPARFLVGMTASVDIIGGKAENALLVPVEAVRDLGDNQYAVFVIDKEGKPRMKVVEVGLMDATYVEIISGLEEGDVISTGAVETN